MANTVIELRYSYATGNVPTSLANGELAINTYDGKLFYRGGASNTIQTITRYTGPAGLDREIQFNDSGVLGSSANLKFDTSGLLSALTFKSTQSSGDEGGQIDLATAVTNTTLLGGNVSIDIYQNKLRFFESGGTNRGAYIDLTAAGAGVTTNLLAGGGGGGNVTSVAGATGAVSNNQLLTGIKTISSTETITFDTVATANNGQGYNFKVGDDIWIGDINVADTMGLKGQQNTANAYITFGNNDGLKLGRAGYGPLTYTGNFLTTGNITGSNVVSQSFIQFGDGTRQYTANTDQLARDTANAAFVTANNSANTNLTQNNSITAAFIAANSAGVYANGAFVTANAAMTSANGNIAWNTANAAFITANNSANTNLTQNNSITAAFTAANSAGVYANGAFVTANNAMTSANGNIAWNTANAAFTTANAAMTSANGNIAWNTANAAFVKANNEGGVNLTQNNSITAAFTRANNSLNANTGGNIVGAVTITGDLSVTGNLSIIGNTVTQNVSSLNISDPIIYLAANNYSSDVVDIGFAANYFDGSQQRHTGLFRDATTKNYYLFDNYLPELSGNNQIDISNSSFRIASINANVISQVITLAGQDLQTYITNAYNKANNEAGVNLTQNNSITAAFAAANAATATDTTQNNSITAAFATANNAANTNLTQNNSITAAFTAANSAGVYANGAFAKANNEGGVNLTQNTNIQYAWNQANAAFDKANTGSSASSSNVTIATFNTTANGTANTYNLGFNPVAANAIFVSIDGVVQPESTYSVNTAANTITFVTNPGNTENVRVVAFANTNPYILADNSIDPVKFSTAANNYISATAFEAAVAMAIALG